MTEHVWMRKHITNVVLGTRKMRITTTPLCLKCAPVSRRNVGVSEHIICVIFVYVSSVCHTRAETESKQLYAMLADYQHCACLAIEAPSLVLFCISRARYHSEPSLMCSHCCRLALGRSNFRDSDPSLTNVNSHSIDRLDTVEHEWVWKNARNKWSELGSYSFSLSLLQKGPHDGRAKIRQASFEQLCHFL